MINLISDLVGCVVAIAILLFILFILFLIPAVIVDLMGIGNEDIEVILTVVLFVIVSFIFFKSKLWRGDY
jgi:hypothetical protein